MTVAFYAEWSALRSWSRIIDFGRAAHDNNFLIANEGGSRHFTVHQYSSKQGRVWKCPNAIDVNQMHHWAVVNKLNGEFAVYKDGSLLENCAFGANQHDGRTSHIEK